MFRVDPSVPAKVSVFEQVSVFPSATASVELVAGAVIAILLMLVAEATPSTGVTSVGDVSITNFVPVPVCEATEVAFPLDVIGPVRLAFVVTVAALPLIEPTIVDENVFAPAIVCVP